MRKTSKVSTDHSISPNKLAGAIGVSESSVKRWVDEGRLIASRTAGGHRRIPVREAVRFLRNHALPLLDPSALGLGEVAHPAAGLRADPAAGEDLTRSVMGGDAEATRSILAARYLSGESPASLCDHAVAPGLRKVGELWKHGPDGIHIEHRAIEICIHGLNTLKGLVPEPDGRAPLAIGCSPSGDPYQIPSLMAAVVLKAAGWRDENLGADLPIEALIAAIEGGRPRLVWISFSSVPAAEAFYKGHRPVMEKADSMGATVVVGGRVCPRQFRSDGSPLNYLPSMETLGAFASALLVQ